jgi:hypothetical protein
LKRVEDVGNGQVIDLGTEVYEAQHGMSLLDYFAGQALAGLLAFSPDGTDASGQMRFGDAASDAYRYAEAMIREREKRAK